MAESIELIAHAEAALASTDVALEQLEAALHNRLAALMHQLAEKVRLNLSGDVLQERTGRLLGTVAEHGPYEVDGGLEATVDAGGDAAPYGIVHEEGGTRDYIIQAVNKRSLAFEMNGKMVFARSVIHPPAEKRPWFGPAVDEMRPLIVEGLQEAINEVTG
jgi:hypothetical protein